VSDEVAGSVRRRFLDDRRAICEQRMDTLHAPTYDERWGSYINQTHQRCVEALLARLGRGALVLDAACGTGKYWAILLEAGVRVVGIDQSSAMLRVAQAKHPSVPITHASLQDLRTRADLTPPVDGLVCIDALENVGPEDWPGVVEGLAGMLRPGSPAYVTVELPEHDLTLDDEAGAAPLVAGEVLENGSYHYYPSIDRARSWLTHYGFSVWGEAEGDGYHHFLLERS
jgi:cyclopropane fatty-acyl-phospholipid synthase-like methyltransferase